MTKARESAGEDLKADFELPRLLTLIEEEAFAGISTETVEVSENVTAIEARAFAVLESHQSPSVKEDPPVKLPYISW